MLKTTAGLALLLFAGSGIAQAAAPNWDGNYPPCTRHSDLSRRGSLDLSVRILTSNPSLAAQFRNAMNFWSEVLDLTWREVDSSDCAIELVDGDPALFESASECGCVSARSQLPDRPGFEGWIAFNPASKLTGREMYRISVHEIGHLLGLSHNPSASSVMFYFDIDAPPVLDAADLASLAARHSLRPGILEKAVFPGGGQNARNSEASSVARARIP